MVKRLVQLGINFAHIMQMNLGMVIIILVLPPVVCSSNRALQMLGTAEWTQVEQNETPGVHFDAGLSRGNFWGFRGGQYYIKKSEECHDLQRKQIKITFLNIKCTNRYNYAATIPGEAG